MRAPPRRAVVRAGAWAAWLAASTPSDPAWAFLKFGAPRPSPNSADELGLDLAMRSAKALGKPSRFGSKLRAQLPFAFSAECLLLSQLPAQCPPLDYLQEEVEKLEVLRLATFLKEVASEDDATKRDAERVSRYWVELADDQREAVQALVDSRPLFRLFIDSSDLRMGNVYLDELERLLRAIEETLRLQQREVSLALQRKMMRQLLYLGNLAATDFPYTVSKAIYNEGLPRLLGRATAQIEVRRTRENVKRRGGYETLTFTAMIDGYSAPITAGNFVDLAQRGYYDELPIDRGNKRLPASLEGPRAVSSGNPSLTPGVNVTGFVDPRTGEYRTLPVEIMDDGATEPTYRPEGMGGRPALPWRASGSIGMVHSLGNPDDASSEFFILTEDVEEGSSVASQLDGVYTLFGFVLEGSEFLFLLDSGDTISSVKITSGESLMARPSFNPTYTRRSGSKSQRDYQMLGGEGLGEYDNDIPADVPIAPERTVRAGERDQARQEAEASSASADAE